MEKKFPVIRGSDAEFYRNPWKFPFQETYSPILSYVPQIFGTVYILKRGDDYNQAKERDTWNRWEMVLGREKV
jgi:hypothetical protein